MSQPDGQGTPYPHGGSSGTPYPHGDGGGQPQGPTAASAPQAPGPGWTQVDDHTYVSPDGQRITMYGTSSTGTVLRQDLIDRAKQDSDNLLNQAAENPILKAFGVDPVILPKSLATVIANIKLQLTLDQQYQQSLQQQAAQLAQGLNLRSSPSMPASSYSGVAHPELKRMVTEGIDPATAGENGQNLITTGNEMTQHQQTFASAITRSQSGWEGSAGDSARGYMGKLTNYVGEAGRGVQLSGTQLSRQSEALSLAKHAMPEPVNFDVPAANARLRQLSADPFTQWAQYAEDMKQYQAQQAAQQHAAEVVRTYDNSLGGSTTAPAFATPPTFGDSGTGRGGGGHGGGSGSGAGHAVPHIGGSAGAGSQSSGSGGNTPRVSGGGPGRSGVLPGVTSGASAGSGYPADFPGGAGGPSSASRHVGSGGDLGAPVPFGGGGIPIGDGDAVRGGVGGRGSASGGSVGAGGAGAASSSGGAQAGAGARSGAGAAAGAAAAEEAAMQRGAAGARGAAGGVGGMGAGRGGKKDEDAEHESPSWLVEPDPDSLFGTDEKTAPPVIGG